MTLNGYNVPFLESKRAPTHTELTLRGSGAYFTLFFSSPAIILLASTHQ